jgi:ATP-dependent protease HslVU (ClpYQ) peptidase subunit
MKKAIAYVVLTAFAGHVSAAATCLQQANEKKLRSHAQEYFMQRCEEEAKKSCEQQAKTKELDGSAKRAFVKKCVADAVGS